MELDLHAKSEIVALPSEEKGVGSAARLNEQGPSREASPGAVELTIEARHIGGARAFTTTAKKGGDGESHARGGVPNAAT